MCTDKLKINTPMSVFATTLRFTFSFGSPSQ